MITIDIALGVSLYLTVMMIFFGFMWFKYAVVDDPVNREASSAGIVRQCPYCSHIIIGNGKTEVVRCPLCQSYLEEGIHDSERIRQ